MKETTTVTVTKEGDVYLVHASHGTEGGSFLYRGATFTNPFVISKKQYDQFEKWYQGVMKLGNRQ